jgi:hypothetical protein
LLQLALAHLGFLGIMDSSSKGTWYDHSKAIDDKDRQERNLPCDHVDCCYACVCAMVNRRWCIQLGIGILSGISV